MIYDVFLAIGRFVDLKCQVTGLNLSKFEVRKGLEDFIVYGQLHTTYLY